MRVDHGLVSLRGWRAFGSLALLVVSFSFWATPAGSSTATPRKNVPLESLGLWEPPRSNNTPALSASYGRLPLTFEKNVGQTGEEVEFLARGRGYTLFLTPQETVLSLRRGEKHDKLRDSREVMRQRDRAEKAGPIVRDVIRMSLVGANPSPRVIGLEEQRGKSNYFIGNDLAKWRTNVPRYARVERENVYPGVDLVYYGNEGRLEHDFVVAAGVDPSVIRLRFAGAKKVSVDVAGSLVLRTKGGEVALQAPTIYQEIAGERRPIAGRYRLTAKNEAGFQVDQYDRRLVLVIDPVLVYSTYLGGSGNESGINVAVDASGSAFVTGNTASVDFPTRNPYQMDPGDGNDDVFVTKMTPAGNDLVFSTYLGGSGADIGRGVAVGPTGNVYVVGSTDSPNFPVQNALQPNRAGYIDVFVAQLSASGNGLVYSTYLGGGGDDYGRSIAVDADGSAYLTGDTRSTTFPVRNPIQTDPGDASEDAFMTKIDVAGSLVYSTYLGGASSDRGESIAIDSAGNAYVTGTTYSWNFPTVRGYQSPPLNGYTDVFVTEVNSSGTGWVFSTCVGGAGHDSAYSVAVDSAGYVYVAGASQSSDFPLLNAIQTNPPGIVDGIAFKLDPSTPNVSLVYSTYLGGSGMYSYAYAIAADSAGHTYVAGYTQASNFPIFRQLQSFGGGSSDAFLTVIAPAGGALVYSTYLGGSGNDYANDIALDAAENVYVLGQTTSTNYPTLNPYQTDQAGTDAFLTRIVDTADVSLTKTDSPDPVLASGNLTYTVTVTNGGPGGATHMTVTDTLPIGLSFISASPGCSVVGQTVTCTAATLASGSNLAFTITVSVGAAAVPSVTNTATVTADQPDPVPGNNTASQTTTVTPVANLSVTQTDSPDPVARNGTLTYAVTVGNAGPSQAASVVLTDTLPAGVVFVSAMPSAGTCGQAAGTVTCNLGTLAASANALVTITVTAPAAATELSNHVAVTSATLDPDATNNAADETTIVYGVVAGNELPFFTATSRDGVNVLQWLNPAAAPYVRTVVRVRDVATFAACELAGGFPANPADGIAVAAQAGLGVGQPDRFEDTGLLSTRTYCYSAFVYKGGGAYSLAKQVKARPIPSGGPVVWGYSTGATTLTPAGLGRGVYAVSNDDVLHAMGRGAAGGEWPAGWIPFRMAGPAQHRPIALNYTVGSATAVVHLASTDGRVYAVDAATGQSLWTTAGYGELLAGPMAWQTRYGATEDLLLVGTRNSGGDNRFLGLDPATGTEVPGWGASQPAGSIGIVNNGGAVDYVNRYVYFTSNARGGSGPTVWCVSLETGDVVWSRALGNMSTGPSLRGNTVYVGTAGGIVYALDTLNNGATLWSYPTGDNAVKSLVFTDRLGDDLYFTTENTIWSLTDTGSAWTLNWSDATISHPTAPLFVTGGIQLYVGSDDGHLYELDVTTGTPVAPPAHRSVALGDGVAAVGTAMRDGGNGLVHVGTEAGVVYAVTIPLL
jgi:uncharacterized repeat protein (TIGR01451 family)